MTPGGAPRPSDTPVHDISTRGRVPLRASQACWPRCACCACCACACVRMHDELPGCPLRSHGRDLDAGQRELCGGTLCCAGLRATACSACSGTNCSSSCRDAWARSDGPVTRMQTQRRDPVHLTDGAPPAAGVERRPRSCRCGRACLRRRVQQGSGRCATRCEHACVCAMCHSLGRCAQLHLAATPVACLSMRARAAAVLRTRPPPHYPQSPVLPTFFRPSASWARSSVTTAAFC